MHAPGLDAPRIRLAHGGEEQRRGLGLRLGRAGQVPQAGEAEADRAALGRAGAQRPLDHERDVELARGVEHQHHGLGRQHRVARGLARAGRDERVALGPRHRVEAQRDVPGARCAQPQPRLATRDPNAPALRVTERPLQRAGEEGGAARVAGADHGTGFQRRRRRLGAGRAGARQALLEPGEEVGRDLRPAARAEVLGDVPLGRCQRRPVGGPVAHAPREAARVVGVHRVGEALAGLRHRALGRGEAELAGRERLAHGQAPALGEGREHGEQAGAVQRLQLRVRHVAHHADQAAKVVGGGELVEQVVDEPALPPDEDQGRRRGRTACPRFNCPGLVAQERPGLEQPLVVLPALERAHTQHEVAAAQVLERLRPRIARIRAARVEAVRQRHGADRRQRTHAQLARHHAGQVVRGVARDGQREIPLRRLALQPPPEVGGDARVHVLGVGHGDEVIDQRAAAHAVGPQQPAQAPPAVSRVPEIAREHVRPRAGEPRPPRARAGRGDKAARRVGVGLGFEAAVQHRLNIRVVQRPDRAGGLLDEGEKHLRAPRRVAQHALDQAELHALDAGDAPGFLKEGEKVADVEQEGREDLAILFHDVGAAALREQEGGAVGAQRPGAARRLRGFGGGHRRALEQRVGEREPGIGVVRPFAHAAPGLDRRVERELGRGSRGGAECRDRRVELRQRLRRGRAGAEARGAQKRLARRGKAPLHPQRVAELQGRVRLAGREGDGAAIGGLGGDGVARVLLHVAQLHPHAPIPGVPGEVARVELRRRLPITEVAGAVGGLARPQRRLLAAALGFEAHGAGEPVGPTWQAHGRGVRGQPRPVKRARSLSPDHARPVMCGRPCAPGHVRPVMRGRACGVGHARPVMRGESCARSRAPRPARPVMRGRSCGASHARRVVRA